MDEFVDALPMRGRTSVLKLLQASGCDAPERNLIDCVRVLRNGFARDITQMEMSLIDVIKSRKDKSTLLKGLCWIHKYEEEKLREGWIIFPFRYRERSVDFYDCCVSRCD
jgi:hypothetical protein